MKTNTLMSTTGWVGRSRLAAGVFTPGCVRRLAVCAASACAILPSPLAQAVLFPAGGPGTGVARIAHATFAEGGASATFTTTPSSSGIGGLEGVPDPFFNPNTADGGAMLSPGFGYPTLIPGPIGFRDTGLQPLAANVPFSWVTGPGGFVPAGMTSAATSLMGVAGNGRAGVALIKDFVHDAPPGGNGIASVSTCGASVDYKNNGVAVVGMRGGHAIAGTLTVPFNLGYVAVAVNTVYEYDPNGFTGPGFGHVGGNPANPIAAGTQWWQPLPIIAVFSGTASLLAPGIQGDLFTTQFPNALTMKFAAASFVPFAMTINPFASLRIRTTVTIIDDAGGSFVEDQTMPDNYKNAFDFGFVGSEDAATWTYPLLSVATVTNKVVVSWSSSYTNFTLQESSTLNAPDWTNVVQTPTDDGTNRSVAITPTAGSSFFRLQQ